jgi:membrane fusion protein, multidrug efflux system
LTHGKTLTVDVFDRAVEKKLASGTLLTVDNQIDSSTGTVKLRAQFSNADLALFPNQFVNARLLVNMLHDVVLVPSPAVQRSAQGAFVYVIGADKQASMRSIKEGTTDGVMTSVEGVNAGDMVATDGFDKLQNGVKVRLRGASGAAAAAGAPAPAADAKNPGKEATKR